MRQAKLQVLGLCRWSYPSQTGAFNNTGESLEALQSELYAAGRMAVRLFFLEHLVLPSLRAQSDPDFTLVLMMGETLPEPWRSRVLELVQDVPQVKPVFLPEGQNHMAACTALMRAHRDENADVVVEFRLDDDDAVASDFVAQLRGLYRQLRPIYKANKRVAVDFCRGFLFRCEDDGGVNYLPVEARLWTPALALYFPPDHPRSLLNYPHMRTWLSMPVLSLNKKPMFVRGAHEGNDSAIKERKVDSFRYKLETLPSVMTSDFGVDLEAFEAALSEVCA